MSCPLEICSGVVLSVEDTEDPLLKIVSVETAQNIYQCFLCNTEEREYPLLKHSRVVVATNGPTLSLKGHEVTSILLLAKKYGEKTFEVEHIQPHPQSSVGSVYGLAARSDDYNILSRDGYLRELRNLRIQDNKLYYGDECLLDDNGYPAVTKYVSEVSLGI